MAWRTVATVIIVVFAALLVLGATADPLVQIGNEFSDVGDAGGQYDEPAIIDDNIRGYFNMFLILIGGVMVWALWRIFRRELTRSGGLGP